MPWWALNLANPTLLNDSVHWGPFFVLFSRSWAGFEWARAAVSGWTGLYQQVLQAAAKSYTSSGAYQIQYGSDLWVYCIYVWFNDVINPSLGRECGWQRWNGSLQTPQWTQTFNIWVSDSSLELSLVHSNLFLSRLQKMIKHPFLLQKGHGSADDE